MRKQTDRRTTWTRRTLVSISGESRTGKDSAAVGLLDRGYALGSFGEQVFELMLELDPILRISDFGGTPLYTHLRELYQIKGGDFEATKAIGEVRAAMQEFGSCIKERDPDFWVDLVMGRADPAVPLVIVGARSRAEVSAVQRAGGTTIRLHRPGVAAMNGHRSDTDLDRCDFMYHITNSGTLEDLRITVDGVLLGDRSLIRLPVEEVTTP